jgi:GlpG protein
MREIGTLPDRDQARRLADYLLTLGIDTQVQADAAGLAVWVRDEDRVEQARQELEAFRRAPDHPRYQEAARRAEALRREEEARDREYERQAAAARARMGPPGPRRWPATIILIGLCMAVTLASNFGQNLAVLRWVAITSWEEDGRLVPDLRQVWGERQYWRLVSPLFLHLDSVHLLFNLWALYAFGVPLEYKLGTRRAVLFVLAVGILSNLLQYYKTANPLFGGMSGVLYAMFGFIWARSRVDPESGWFMPPVNVVLMMGFFGLCWTGLLGPIANWAHLGGLLGGLLLGVLPGRRG